MTKLFWLSIIILVFSAGITYINKEKIEIEKTNAVLSNNYEQKKGKLGNSIAGRPKIIDGDSVEVNNIKIRIQGIDAPEKAQKCLNGFGKTYSCGIKSKEALEELTDGTIECIGSRLDRYKRTIATCYNKSGKDVAKEMVARGWALAYRQYSSDYVEDENIAAQKKMGIWQGEFIDPWDWRKGKRID